MKNTQQLPPWITTQNEWWIQTLDNSLKFPARIYSEEQRDTIKKLISDGYIPMKTCPGKGKCTKKHWNLESYNGRNGQGYRMISSYKHSHNLNSITYFIKQAS